MFKAGPQGRSLFLQWILFNAKIIWPKCGTNRTPLVAWPKVCLWCWLYLGTHLNFPWYGNTKDLSTPTGQDQLQQLIFIKLFVPKLATNILSQSLIVCLSPPLFFHWGCSFTFFETTFLSIKSNTGGDVKTAWMFTQQSTLFKRPCFHHYFCSAAKTKRVKAHISKIKTIADVALAGFAGEVKEGTE